MNNELKALSVAAAFAAALTSSTPAQANIPEPIARPSLSVEKEQLQPSPAALRRLEEVAQTAWWWPWLPPRFIDLWPEVTHVETVRTA